MPIPPRPRHLAPAAGDRGLWFVARVTTENMVVVCNKWHLEEHPGDRTALLAGPSSTFQAVAFERLANSVHRIVRPCAEMFHGQGRGAQSLHLMIDQFLEYWPMLSEGDPFKVSGPVTAQKIDVASFRFPASAGHLNAASLLPSVAAREFTDGARRLVPQHNVPVPLSRPCSMVPVAEEPSLRRRLLSTNMVTLIPKSRVALRPDGR